MSYFEYQNGNQVLISEGYKEKGLRKKLVQVLVQKGIKDIRVLQAIEKVPRHIFFDKALLSHAYEDKAFPIGEGQTISQPFTVAFQTEKLAIQAGEKVLEVGTGSGYQAAILCEMGAKVITIEYNEILYRHTKTVLPQIGYKPVFILGDGSMGFPARAPYNKIIVTAGAPSVPEALLQQLVVNGKMIIPVGDRTVQTMLLITKISEKEFTTEKFPSFSFVPLLGKSGWLN